MDFIGKISITVNNCYMIINGIKYGTLLKTYTKVEIEQIIFNKINATIMSISTDINNLPSSTLENIDPLKLLKKGQYQHYSFHCTFLFTINLFIVLMVYIIYKIYKWKFQVTRRIMAPTAPTNENFVIIPNETNKRLTVERKVHAAQQEFAYSWEILNNQIS